MGYPVEHRLSFLTRIIKKNLLRNDLLARLLIHCSRRILLDLVRMGFLQNPSDEGKNENPKKEKKKKKKQKNKKKEKKKEQRKKRKEGRKRWARVIHHGSHQPLLTDPLQKVHQYRRPIVQLCAPLKRSKRAVMTRLMCIFGAPTNNWFSSRPTISIILPARRWTCLAICIVYYQPGHRRGRGREVARQGGGKNDFIFAH